MQLKLLVVNILLFIATCSSDHPCQKRATENGFICVCNAKYCDTITKPVKLSHKQYHIYTSSSSTPGFNHRLGHFNDSGSTFTGSKYEVNIKKKYQKLRGFGAAFTDSFGYTFNTLSKKAQNKLIRSFFAKDGLEYNLCRVAFGSSDFALRQYTYAPEFDASLKSFSLTHDDYIYKIKQIKQALKVASRKLNLFGTTWTPPEWMKINNMTGTDFLLMKYHKTWADYHVKILQAFKKEGIDFWGLTTGNEPITLYTFKGVNLPSLAMFPEEQRTWVIEHLGPALKKANLPTKIILLDDQREYALWWMNTVFQDKEAKDHVFGIGLHWYFDNMVSPKTMDEIHSKYPDQEIVYTESSVNTLVHSSINIKHKLQNSKVSSLDRKTGFDPSPPLLGVWNRAEKYILNIIENLNHWVTSYVDWNLALDVNGGPNLVNLTCDASIIVNKTSDEFYKQPIFYAMGHFSKFLQPKSVVIKVEKVNSFWSSSDEPKDHLGRSNKKHSPVGSTKLPPFPSGSPPPGPRGHTGTGIVVPTTPSTISEIVNIGALNPDGSSTIIFYNKYSSSQQIALKVPHRGIAILNLEPYSITSIVYW